MAKGKKNKPDTDARRNDPERAARTRRLVLHLCLAALFAGAGATAFCLARQYVDREVAAAVGPLIVVVKNRPPWMTDLLVRQIASAAQPPVPQQSTGASHAGGTAAHHAGLAALTDAPPASNGYSSFDRQLLIETKKRLDADPWVLHVRQVRRAFSYSPGDTIEIDCDYRVPGALVKWGGYYWLVDRDGYKLPEQYTPRDVPKVVMSEDQRINIRIIEGVRRPPPEVGLKWPGEDLAAGLDMAAALAYRPYTEQILKINVANFGGRINDKDAHLVLVTRYGSEIRWGRPPADRESFEIPAGQKLEYLQRVYQQFGRVDARQPWIDVRFDSMRIPAQSGGGSRSDARQ